MMSWITAHLRLTLLAALAGVVLVAAGALYWKGRHDAAARVQPQLAAAVAAAKASALETTGARDSAQRTATAVGQREAATATVVKATAQAFTAEDAHAPLSSDRTARLRDADRQLCLTDGALAGCPASGHAG